MWITGVPGVQSEMQYTEKQENTPKLMKKINTEFQKDLPFSDKINIKKSDFHIGESSLI